MCSALGALEAASLAALLACHRMCVTYADIQ